MVKTDCTFEKIQYALLIIFISVLTFGMIFFSKKVSKNEPTVRRHRAICKYMGMEFYGRSSNFAPDFGAFPSLDNAKYPMVNTPDIAANVGITVLSSFYGEKMTELQKPYRVSLINGEVWDIRGSIPYKDFYIMIQRSDCRILSIGGYSYTEYITGESVSFKEKMDQTDFISSYSLMPHLSLAYQYQGERYGEKLPFGRLPFPKGYLEEKVLREWMPDNGYTPDSSVYELPYGAVKDYETAAKVGIIILSSRYGDKHIQKQFPFEVVLRGSDHWALMGSLYPKGAFGGTAHINIQKADCRIICYYHEK